MHEHDLCIYCRADLPLTHYWMQPHNPMADRFNLLIQRDVERSGQVEPYARAAALFFYHSSAGYRRIPQALKYGSDVEAGIRFAHLLGTKLLESPFLRDVEVVAPVPLHWRRKWSRGYNQAEVLAREIARTLGARLLPHLLVRRRATRTQTRLSRDEKARNVARAFRLGSDSGAVTAGMHVLLVDDVFTTGATLHACYRVLRDAFPDATISVATLAVVGP